VGKLGARRVLILVSGYGGAAGLLAPLARQLVAHESDLQVWLVDRREQVLAHAISRGESLSSEARAAARSWGLTQTLLDLRSVVRAARGRGRRAFLGGHSWGATIASAYAAWDFSGEPGFEDLDGLVLIDGGVLDSFAGEGIVFRVTAAEAAQRLAGINSGDPFDATLSSLVGGQSAEAAGRFYRALGAAALAAPDELATLAAALPKTIAPPFPVTNRALLGWLFDAGAAVPDLKLDLGELATQGNPREWQDGGRCSITDFAQAISGSEPLAFEWCWPKRLTLDLEAVDRFEQDEVTRALGLRLGHIESIDVPLYVFQTGLTSGSVFSAVNRLADRSRIRQLWHAEDATMGHLDPLFAPAGHNNLIPSLIEFARRF
jgi:pimeloyl-ACP methyl ester carboxylesterase